MSRTFVIVGGGLAGAKAAESLREQGFDGRLVVLAEEPTAPYERPPLSKDYLRGETARAQLLVHPESWLTSQGIELRTNAPVLELCPHEREVVLDGGERLRFARLLLATGASPRRPAVPGAQLEGVHELRTLADADTLRALLTPGVRLTIVGAGWLGCEVAASARQLGADVTLLEALAVPLQRVLGTRLGVVYRELHREHGVRWRLGEGVERFEGRDGRVIGVRTTGGSLIASDVVLVAVGVDPRTELAQAAGLQLHDGVVVDARLQTSAPGVFAAGDVARHAHPRWGPLRVEHWANAVHQGEAAARAMLDGADAYSRTPYFFSDQYDAALEYWGYAGATDELVVRGDPTARRFSAFWLRDGMVTAGARVGDQDPAEAIRVLVERGGLVDRRLLADPERALESVMVAAGRNGAAHGAAPTGRHHSSPTVDAPDAA